MRTYDIHTHAFHPKIAERAVGQLYDYYHIDPAGDGTLEDLQRKISEAGLDCAVVHSAATTPEQVVPANNWAIQLQQKAEGILAFGTVHTGFAEWEKEFDRLEAAGVRGIKLHPDFQGIWLDDKELEPIFEAAAGRFVMMFHVGDRRAPEKNFSCPFKIAAIKRKFPRLQMIAAHLGGLFHWQHVPQELAGLGIYIDTSSCLQFIGEGQLQAIIAAIPRNLWLFGSDYPLMTPLQSLELLQKRLHLTTVQAEEFLTNAGQIFA